MDSDNNHINITKDNCLPSKYRAYVRERDLGIEQIVHDYRIKCALVFISVVQLFTNIFTLKVWKKGDMVRVYFPAKTGFVGIGYDGTINGIDFVVHGFGTYDRVTLNTASMHKSWVAGLHKATTEYLVKQAELLTAKEAKIDDLLKSLDEKYKEWVI